MTLAVKIPRFYGDPAFCFNNEDLSFFLTLMRIRPNLSNETLTEV